MSCLCFRFRPRNICAMQHASHEASPNVLRRKNPMRVTLLLFTSMKKCDYLGLYTLDFSNKNSISFCKCLTVGYYCQRNNNQRYARDAGWCPTQATVSSGVRWGTYRAFLRRARHRDGLTILTHATVTKARMSFEHTSNHVNIYINTPPPR